MTQKKRRNSVQQPGGFCFAVVGSFAFVQYIGGVQIPPEPRGPFLTERSQISLFPTFRCPDSLLARVWLHCQGLLHLP